MKLRGNAVLIERLLEPGSIETPVCLCGTEMRLAKADVPASAHETEIRTFRCAVCEDEMRLTVWIGLMYFNGELCPL